MDVKDGTEVTLKLSSNAVSGSNDATSFPQKLLLTSKQVSMLSMAFPNNSSANVKLSKTRLHETGKSGGFLGRLLWTLLKTGLPSMENVLKPLEMYLKDYIR